MTLSFGRSQKGSSEFGIAHILIIDDSETRAV